MIDKIVVEHYIQKHVLDVLMYREFARFSELRPSGVDTNLYSYHLKLLQKNGLVEKSESGYHLGRDGLNYVDRLSSTKMSIRNQPEIITMLLIQNSEGEVLLQLRNKQPYINHWTLPYGKLHIDDTSTSAAAIRIANEKLSVDIGDVKHIGNAYIRVVDEGEVLNSTLVHVFRFNSDYIKSSDSTIWAKPHKLTKLKLAPAVEQIIARSFFNDPFYSEEYNVELTD